MPNPNAGILEEIGDQNLSGMAVGAEANPNSLSIASTCVTCAASWAVGNDGWACTVTVECVEAC